MELEKKLRCTRIQVRNLPLLTEGRGVKCLREGSLLGRINGSLGLETLLEKINLLSSVGLKLLCSPQPLLCKYKPSLLLSSSVGQQRRVLLQGSFPPNKAGIRKSSPPCHLVWWWQEYQDVHQLFLPFSISRTQGSLFCAKSWEPRRRR